MIALIAPRFLIVALWLFSDWFTGVFDLVLWPVLGFFFTPTTLLWYTVVEHWYGGQWGTLQIIVVVITLLIDLSPASSNRKRKT